MRVRIEAGQSPWEKPDPRFQASSGARIILGSALTSCVCHREAGGPGTIQPGRCLLTLFPVTQDLEASGTRTQLQLAPQTTSVLLWGGGEGEQSSCSEARKACSEILLMTKDPRWPKRAREKCSPVYTKILVDAPIFNMRQKS